MLKITLPSTGESVNISLNTNETSVILSAQHGVEDNLQYTYTISAFNDVGTSVSHQNGNGKDLGKYAL